mmetsp:Transcript_22109/g.39370  ORF Transcript_22109/g.39370 Transcript_22109/m.39370 type:complete len:108 (-) Transcript_22109:235-558(-)|eukprot:CAMPEP_0175083076 /NCGR_PEP_ID=MMETSP0052_2-20121109/27135_1 /TAXON_ID=51329 ORGANISM="Polytomella parva, Strain SAG 63-3" /NCGR_SAMPLE_ID=MMETSP0052_2 /ASSEMBLY_ACC=CAM_ASM_000194 /LENGTH=107 /DNA_ID=CAMNT_0016354393 /DNA_START=242 /DNA_END=565 /DNA_ORIENTATION=-
MKGLEKDLDVQNFVYQNPKQMAIVQFGASWCTKCVEFLPTWVDLSMKFPQHRYAVAQMDTLKETSKHVKFSPTFGFFKQNRMVDSVVGKDAQRLSDHLWLWDDENPK